VPLDVARLMYDGTDYVSAAHPLPVSVISGGNTPVVPGTTSATVTKNASAAVELFADNPTAQGRKIYNFVANGVLWVKYGSAPTGESNCSFPIQPGQTWEMPSFSGVIEYSGVIYGLLVSGTSVNTTEVTP